MDLIQPTLHHPDPMLFRMSQSELDQLFETLPAVALRTLSGAFRGRLLGISGINLLPRSLRAALYQLLQTPLNPWRGKYFMNGCGSNLWLSLRGQLRFAHYRVELNPASGIESLNYDIEDNWRVLRGIRGEARQLNDRVVLARMNYQARARCVRVLYFTLEMP